MDANWDGVFCWQIWAYELFLLNTDYTLITWNSVISFKFGEVTEFT